MFDTSGKSEGSQSRKPYIFKKLERMNKTLCHEEPDRVPFRDTFRGRAAQRPGQFCLDCANAARGVGLTFQSDHSVASDVPGIIYDYIVHLVREYGKYPLQLGEFDLKTTEPMKGKS